VLLAYTDGLTDDLAAITAHRDKALLRQVDSTAVEINVAYLCTEIPTAIQQALENCYASNPNLEIHEVYVGIAGHHIKSLQTRGDIVRQNSDEEISYKEIDQLIADQYKTYIPAGDQIIDVIPQEFTVDNFQNIPNPI